MLCRCAALLACLASPFWSARAHADAPLAVRLRFDAPAECPDGKAFLGQLQARSSRIREAQPGEIAPGVQVVLRRDGGQVHGTLTVSPIGAPLGGESGMREIRGDDCPSVAEGLALIAIVILDPSAVAPADVSPPPAPAAVPLEPALPTRPSSSVRTSLPARQALRLSIGAAVEGVAGQGPGPVFEPRAFLDVELPGAASKGSIRLSAGHSYPRTVETAIGAAQIALTDVRLELCFDPWSAGALQVRTCGLAEGGALSGQGMDTNLPKSASRGILELGIGIRPVWALTDQVTVGLLVAVAAPLARYRFYFTLPDTTAYRLSAWSAWGELGVCVRFL